MQPSSALGTFLRYWRSEWAGLSRAQLALAVAAQCTGKRKRVTGEVVRAWERGQPPASTEELDALLAVMRRHGLSEPEAGHVRRAVFAACLHRHYPELFPAEEFAQQPQVDELAEASLGGWPQAPASHDPVALVGQLTSLGRAVGHDTEPAPPGSQRRRQQVALAYTLATANWYCEATSRMGLAARYAGAAVAHVQACFGPAGVGSWVTVPHLRNVQLADIGYAAGSSGPVAEMLELSRAAEARGDRTMAANAFKHAFGLTYADGAEELRGAMWPEVDRHLEFLVPQDLVELLPGAVADRLWARAEAWAAELEYLRHGNVWEQMGWHVLMSNFAFGRGDIDEAEEHWLAAAQLAPRCGSVGVAAQAPLFLRACEEARKHRRRASRSADHV